MERIEREKLRAKLILLTHAHPDHIEDLERLRKKTGAPVFISEREPAAGAQSFAEGKQFQVGKLKIETRLTWGHSPGGTTSRALHVLQNGRFSAVLTDAIDAAYQRTLEMGAKLDEQVAAAKAGT